MRTWSLNRLFALVIGIVFLLVGILGLLLDPTKGNLIGLFSVNIVHNLVHVLIGVLGIIAAFTGWPRYYNRGLGIVYLLVGILGFIPALTPGGELLGVMDVNLADNILHLVVGAVAAYLGFFVRESAVRVSPTA